MGPWMPTWGSGPASLQHGRSRGGDDRHMTHDRNTHDSSIVVRCSRLLFHHPDLASKMM